MHHYQILTAAVNHQTNLQVVAREANIVEMKPDGSVATPVNCTDQEGTLSYPHHHELAPSNDGAASSTSSLASADNHVRIDFLLIECYSNSYICNGIFTDMTSVIAKKRISHWYSVVITW